MANTKAVKPKAPVIEVDLGYLTDKQLDALGLEPETAVQTVADAALVYEHVGRHPHIDRQALSKYAASKWGDEAIDRLNAAVDFLKASGKLIG